MYLNKNMNRIATWLLFLLGIGVWLGLAYLWADPENIVMDWADSASNSYVDLSDMSSDSEEEVMIDDAIDNMSDDMLWMFPIFTAKQMTGSVYDDDVLHLSGTVYEVCTNQEVSGLDTCSWVAVVSDQAPQYVVYSDFADSIVADSTTRGAIIEDIETYWIYPHWYYYILDDGSYLYISNPLIPIEGVIFPFDYVLY